MEYNKEYAKKVYAGLTKRGYTADELGDETKFVERMADEGNRKYLYDQVQKRGDAKMGSWEHFNSKMMEVAPVVEQRGEASTPAPGERAWWQTEVNAPKAEASPYPVNPVEFQGQVDQEEKAIAERLPQANAAMSQRMLAGQTMQGAFNRFLAGDTYAKMGTPEYARAKMVQARHDYANMPSEAREKLLEQMGGKEKLGAEFEKMNGRQPKDEMEVYEWMTGGYAVRPEFATEKTDANDIAKYNGYSANEINAGMGDEKAVALFTKDILSPQLKAAQEKTNEMLKERDTELQGAYYDEYRKNAGIPGYYPDDTSWGGKGRAMDKDWQMLKAAENINRETEQLVDAAVNDRNGWTAFGRTLANIDTWFPVMSGLELSALMELKNVDPEKASPAQKALMEALALRASAEASYEGDISNWYKVGEGVANMVPLWFEMAFNPLSGVGKAAAKKVAKGVMKSQTKKALAESGKAAMKQWQRRVLAKGAGFLGSLAGGAGMAATTSLPKVAVGAGLNSMGQAQYDINAGGIELDSMMPGGSYWSEFGKELARTAIEHGTEQMGAEWLGKALGKPLKWVGKGVSKIPGVGKGVTRTAQFLEDLGGEKYELLKNLAKDVKYDGPLEEFGEEFMSALLTRPIDDDSLKKFFEKDNLLVTLGTVVTPFGVGATMAGGYNAFKGNYKAGARERNKQLAASVRAAGSFGENQEEWKNIKYNLNNADTFVEEMQRIYNSPDYTNEQKKNALEYAVHTLRYMAATGSQIDLDENTQLLNGMLRESYGWAYENTVPEAVNGNVVMAADKALRDAESAAKTALGLQSDTSIEDFVGNRSVDEVAMGDDAVAEALRTYYAEKAIFEGMQDKMQNARENEYAEADKSVDAVAHKENDVYSGNIYRTTLSQNGEEIFITGGKVVLDKDGYIDVNQSERLVALINGEHKAIQPGSLREKVTVESVEAQKAAKRAEIDARYRQQLNTFTYKDEQGNHTIQLVTRGEEMSRVLLDGVEQDMPTRLYDKIVAEASQAESGTSGRRPEGPKAKVEGENEVVPSENQSTVPTAEEVADAQAFADAYAANTLEAYQNYLDNHPEGAYREGARHGMWALEGTSSVADIASITNAENVLQRAAANEVQPEVAPVVEGQKGEKAVESSPTGEVAAPVVEAPKTALEQIPRNENNIPLYEQVDSELAWDGVVEEAGGNEETAMIAVNSMIADKQDALKKAEKAKAKAGATITEKIAAENERVANIEKAKADLAKWQEIAGVKAKRETAAVESAPVVEETQAPVVESVPVAEVETPQATNEMQEADLENAEKGEKGQKAVEPVGETDSSTLSQTSEQVAEGGNAPGSGGVVESVNRRRIEANLMQMRAADGDAIMSAEQKSEAVLAAAKRIKKFADELTHDELVEVEAMEAKYRQAEKYVNPEDLTEAFASIDREQNRATEKAMPSIMARGKNGKVRYYYIDMDMPVSDFQINGSDTYPSLKALYEEDVYGSRFLKEHNIDPEVLPTPGKYRLLGYNNLGYYIDFNGGEYFIPGFGAPELVEELIKKGEYRGIYNSDAPLKVESKPKAEVVPVVESTSVEQAANEMQPVQKTQNTEAVAEMETEAESAKPRANVNTYSVVKSENEKKVLRERAAKWGKKLGVKVHVLESYDEVTDEQAKVAILEQRVPGWFAGGEVYIYMPHLVDEVDLDRTVVHESVAHKGIKQMLGEEFNKFLDNVWKMMSVPARAKFLSYVGAGKNASQADRRAAADEYVAALAEKVYKKQGMTAEERTIWQKIADWFRKAFNVDEAKAEVLSKEALTDEDIARMIRASYETLKAESGKVEGESGGDFRARKDNEGTRFSKKSGNKKSHKNQPASSDKKSAGLNHSSTVDTSAKTVTKIKINTETAKLELEKLAEAYKGSKKVRGFLGDLAMALGDKQPKESYYFEFKNKKGEVYTLRIANHNVNGDNARADEQEISIVVKSRRSKNTFTFKEGLKEFVYFKEHIKNGDGNTLELIAKDISNLLDTGVYVDSSGIAAVNPKENSSKDGTMFRRANKNQDIFVSNAQRAVEGIKQEKATPEQWIAMLKKNGGLKAGEEAWLGLEEWLTEKGKGKAADKRAQSTSSLDAMPSESGLREAKGENGKTDPSAAGGSSPKTGAQSTVTKQEILDFIGENKIQIEEVNYTQFGYGLIDEATRKLEAELKEIGWDAMVEKYPGFDELFEVYDGELLWSEERASVGEYEDFIIDNKIVDLDSQSNAINETREKYTTEGLENKREIALVVPTVEPYNASDEIHFGDAGNGRAVAWVRFGETTDSEGNRVLVIDEIQSKRHQDGREKGYKNPNAEAELEKAEDAYREAIKAEKAYNAELKEKYGYDSFEGSLFQRAEQFVNSLTEEEKAKRNELKREKEELAAAYENLLKSVNDKGVPAAPFEKNWQELAMKRMLRLAAEEGFDKVAWTTGEQQARRYDIGAVVNRIESNDTVDYDSTLGVDLIKQVVLFTRDGNAITLRLTPEGIVRASSQYNGHHISDIVGKELGNRIMTETDLVLKEQDLRIGGEGMKGFYDKMLPSFVSKYTKKWGAKVGEVTMPNLRENNTMHSVDVTPEMQESVMEGQTMFRKMNKHAEEFNKTHKGGVPVVEIDPNNMEADFAEDGFATEEIEELKERMKKGVAAVYNTDKKIIYLLVPSQDKESVYSTCWHEDTHAAIDFLGLTPEMMDEFYSFAQGKKKEAFEALLDKIGYEIEDYPEESLAYGVQAMHILDNWGAETLSKLFGSTAEGAQRQMEIIQPLIDYINNGRQGTQGSVGEVVRDRGMYNNTANQKKTAETEGTGATATRGLTEEVTEQEERTLFRRAEQMGEDEVVLTGNAVAALGEKLNIPARVVNDVESLPENKRNKKGWFENGEVVVVLPNHVSMEDAMQTVLHEVVGRKGLRAVMGEEFDALLDVVYRNLPKGVKSRINYVVMTRFVTPRQATEEYIAGLAGKNSQDAVLNDIMQRMGDYFRGAMNLEVEDGELRYMLWKNNQRLQTPDVLSMLQDFVMETETNTGDNGTRFRVVNDTTEKYEKSVKGFWNKFKEAYYDRLRSVRKAQEIIAQETGMPISDSEDVYSYAEHLPSINKSMKEVFDITYMTPFVELLQKIYEKTFNGKKIDEKTLERYANAKHGLERNRELAVKKALTTFEEVKGRKVPVFNKDAYADWVAKKAAILNDGSLSWEQKQEALDRLAKTYGAKLKDYSGLTAIFDSNGGMKYKDINRAAIDYVLSMEAALGNDTKALWKLIKLMTGYSLKQSYESGLLAKEAYEAISSMYEFYVPLRGFTEKTAEDYYDYVASEARPLNSVIIAASGRKSEADNIFATILNMANSAIVYGNKNRLKQRVLNLATRHNSPLLSVDNAWYIKMGDDYILQLPNITENMTEEQIAEEHARFDAIMKEKEKNGEAVRHSQGLNIGVNVAMDANKIQHAIRVKRNGREYIVWVNGSPTMANAINGMLKEDEVGFFGNAMDVVNKFRSKMVTQYSPTFVLTNLFRDVQSSSTVYGVRRGRRALGRFLKNVRRNSVNMGVLYWKYKHGALDENKLIERYFKEFLENGGETGYTEMISIDEYNKMLNELTEKMNIGNAPVRAIEAAGDMVEFANRCIENLCRFSAYMTSREDGVSILQSINDAKEVSVNFNRKGSGAMGAGILKRWFMFFNPAVQSVAQRILLLQNYPKRMIPIMAMELTAGAMMPYLYATLKALLFGGDDDDETWDDKLNSALGDYYNMTDYRRRSSIILPTKDGSINPPLSHEARVLYGVGELITSIVNGHEKYDNIPSQVVNILGQSLPFNPVEGWNQNDNLTESLMKNLSPDAIKPFVEIAYNSDFAGNRIHNRSDYNEYLPEYMRGRKGTGAGFNAISKTISGGESGFERGWADRNLSVFANPSSLEHLVEGYLGGAYTFFNKAVKSVRWASGNEEFADSRNIPFVSSFYTSLDKYEANPDGERTRRDWEDAFKYYQEEVNIIDGKEKAAKAGEKQELPGAADLLKAMGENGDMLAVDIFNDGNKVLKELYADVDVARTAKDFDSVEELDKKIYAQKRAMVERMEQMAENPMIGYTFNTNKSDDEYGQRETYGDVRDMNVINEFQRELKPLFEAYVEELKTLGEIEQLALYQKNEKMVLLYNTLKRKEQLISNNKKAMKKKPEKADEYMDNIRRFRAEAVELINKYRNE